MLYCSVCHTALYVILHCMLYCALYVILYCMSYCTVCYTALYVILCTECYVVLYVIMCTVCYIVLYVILHCMLYWTVCYTVTCMLYCTMCYIVLHVMLHCMLYWTVYYTALYVILYCMLYCALYVYHIVLCVILHCMLYCIACYIALYVILHCMLIYCTVCYTVHCMLYCTVCYKHCMLYCTVCYTVHCMLYCTVCYTALYVVLCIVCYIVLYVILCTVCYIALCVARTKGWLKLLLSNIRFSEKEELWIKNKHKKKKCLFRAKFLSRGVYAFVSMRAEEMRSEVGWKKRERCWQTNLDQKRIAHTRHMVFERPCTGAFQIREQFVRRRSKGSATSVRGKTVEEVRGQCTTKVAESQCCEVEIDAWFDGDPVKGYQWRFYMLTALFTKDQATWVVLYSLLS